jgi:hypothetical protein
VPAQFGSDRSPADLLVEIGTDPGRAVRWWFALQAAAPCRYADRNRAARWSSAIAQPVSPGDPAGIPWCVSSTVVRPPSSWNWTSTRVSGCAWSASVSV